MSAARRKGEDDTPAEFELLFTATGSVALYDAETEDLVWSSDNDENFAEEFDGDFFDASDEDEIVEYLTDLGFIEDDSLIDIIEEDADEDDDEKDDKNNNVITGEFIPARRPKR